jgi:FkbM family methyltransferase
MLFKYLKKAHNDYDDYRFIAKNAVKGIKKYRRILKHYPYTIIDVGAHKGSVSLYGLKHGAKDVLAIEAFITNFMELRENLSKIKLKKDQKYELMGVALAGERDQIRKFYIYEKGNTGQRSLVFNNKEKILKKCVTHYVKTVDIHQLFNHKIFETGFKHMPFRIIDYLKVDIEGSEYEAFPLTEETKKYFQRVRFLDIEFHPIKPPFFSTEEAIAHIEHINKNENITRQYIRFFNSCGFKSELKNYQNGYKLCTFNRHIHLL